MPSDPRSLRQRLFPTCHRTILEKFLEQYLPDNVRGRVLIVGAGHSPHQALLDASCEVTCLDIAPLPGIDVVADLRRLPFEAASFDAVLCVEVLEHVFGTEKALGEMQRVVKPGGTVLITTPFMFHLHGDPNDFVRLSGNFFAEALAPGFDVDVFQYGRRLHVFLDLITTLSPVMVPLRVISHFVTPLAWCLRSRSDAPTGTIAIARKHDVDHPISGAAGSA